MMNRTTAPADGRAGQAASAWVHSAFTWPAWARTARIAGAYFHPGDSRTALATRLDSLAAAHVSVVLADSPWGQHYAVWVDDERFWPVQQLIARVASMAHARGLKVVLYQTGLELLADQDRNPAAEHPDWLQRALDGRPVLFDDVTNDEQHWLQHGVWDCWLSPASRGWPGTYRELFLARVSAMVSTGIDGLWVDQVYLQSSVGHHHDLWPSCDGPSAAAFQMATGTPLPAAANWEDPTFCRWVVWRHSQIADFLLHEKEVARRVNPGLVFLNENSNLDTGRSTYVANDPTSYRVCPDMTTGHEVETIGDRMDEGETGMKQASLEQWLAFRTMIAFARAADRGKPSWILTYGYEPRDSAQLAGMVLAAGGNFYETKGPQMAETVDLRHRTDLFRWIADNESAFYASESLAHVALLYSPRTRDLVDTCSGQPYDADGSVHFAAYRAAASRLYLAHIPFDVVIDGDTASFGHYRVLIVPEVQAMSQATAAALADFSGLLITIGRSGLYDEWLRPVGLLDGVSQHHFAHLTRAALPLVNTGLLATDAPAAVQFGLRRTHSGYSLVVVNTARRRTHACRVELRLPHGERIRRASLDVFGRGRTELPFAFSAESEAIEVKIPAGIDTVALLSLSKRTASAGSRGRDARRRDLRQAEAGA